MPLDFSTLKDGLENDWLAREGGDFPASNVESGKRFAGTVVSWFSAAQANGLPCATARARQPQLAAQAAQALASGSGPSAGAALAAAVAAYLTGQVFGAGTASPPLATPAASALLGAVFMDTQADGSTRAQQVAQACELLVRSTLVLFPPPAPPTAPIT